MLFFLRQSTEVNNEAYTFARKAQQEGIAIIDYPDAILKCCNKVYMAEALNNANIGRQKR
jgi:glutathione synthase/RimK-type ligase-like ATP-grasp enzyme